MNRFFRLIAAITAAFGTTTNGTASTFSEVLMVENTHQSHTTDEQGNFKHPFLQASSDLGVIQYTESKTFSVRLEKKPGPSRFGDVEQDTPRAFTKESARRWGKYMWTQLLELFSPSQATFKNNLTNRNNLVYYGPIYMGTPLQTLAGVIWDTGSGSFLVESSKCSNCFGDVYQTSSSTYQRDSQGRSNTVTYLDGTSLSGEYSLDRVCVSSDVSSCASDFFFLALTEQSGLSSYEDGIMGMWRGQVETQTHYVPWLAKKGAITEPTFSFYLTGTAGSSYIDFGTPDASIIGDGSQIHWVENKKDQYWWVNSVEGFKWGPGGEDQATPMYLFYPIDGLTDTGSSCIVGPKAYIKLIYDAIAAKTSARGTTESSWEDIFWCDDVSSLPSFYLLFGGYWFLVEPADYFVNIGISTTGRNICALCLTYVDGFEKWILGDVFMRGWYNIHDHANDRFGFIPFSGSTKTTPTVYVPSDSDPERLANPFLAVEDSNIFGLDPDVFYTVVVVIVVVIFATVALIVAFCYSLLLRSGKTPKPNGHGTGAQETPFQLIILP